MNNFVANGIVVAEINQMMRQNSSETRFGHNSVSILQSALLFLGSWSPQGSGDAEPGSRRLSGSLNRDWQYYSCDWPLWRYCLQRAEGRCMVSFSQCKTAFSKKNPRQGPFSLSRVGKIASRRGVENRGSLISVPLALRVEKSWQGIPPASVTATLINYCWAGSKL